MKQAKIEGANVPLIITKSKWSCFCKCGDKVFRPFGITLSS